MNKDIAASAVLATPGYVVTGSWSVGDRGGGEYYFDPTDTTSADNGGTIIVATDGARWKLIHRGVVYVEQFGAKGDGTTNDATAILAALASTAGTVKLSNKPYRVSQTIAVPAGKSLQGDSSAAVAGTITDSAPLIFGDLSVTPIVSVSSGPLQESPALQQVDSIVTGNTISGTAIINQGSQVVTGNFFYGNVTLEGVSGRTVFVGNAINGTMTNTMTGTATIANNG